MRLKPCLLVLLLSGCSGPPTHFYTLVPVAPAHGPTAAAVCRGDSLMVHHVLLPETLDRQSIVRAMGPDRLEISNQDRWAAPLDGMVQRILAEDLRDLLPPGRVLMPGDPTPSAGTSALDVNLRKFLPDQAGRVTLEADWALLGRHHQPMAARSETIRTGPSSHDTDDTVHAMSQAIAVLADRIASVIPACPAHSRAGRPPRG